MNQFDFFKDERSGIFQLRTKTTSFSIEFDDKEKEEIFVSVVQLLQSKPSSSIRDLRLKIQTKDNEAKVLEVLSELNQFDLLPQEISVRLPIDGELDNTMSIKSLHEYTLAILGSGDLWDSMLTRAKKSDFKEVVALEYSTSLTEKEIEQAVVKSDFIVVDASEWSPFHIEKINFFALKHQKPWLYIDGIEENAIKIGPLFYGRESGCYNCLISRLKSNHDYPAFLTSYEDFLRKNKKAAKPNQAIHPSVLHSLIIDITLLEIIKFIEGWAIPSSWRSVIKIDYLNLGFDKSTLLKKPYCEICKPGLEYNSAPWLEAVTLK